MAGIQGWISQANNDEKQLLSRLFKSSDKEAAKAYKKQSVELAKAEKRKAEVDDCSLSSMRIGRVGDLRSITSRCCCGSISQNSRSLLGRLADFATEKQTTADVEKWIDLIKRYSSPTELTAEMLNTLIEKIVVHEATKGYEGIRTQETEIFYRFVGEKDQNTDVRL